MDIINIDILSVLSVYTSIGMDIISIYRIAYSK